MFGLLKANNWTGEGELKKPVVTATTRSASPSRYQARTVRPGLAPSQLVVAVASRNTFPQFLATAAKTVILVKFIRDRLHLSRAEGTSLAA